MKNREIHYFVASYNSHYDEITIVPQIVSSRQEAVQLLREQVIEGLCDYLGYNHEVAKMILDRAIKFGDHCECEYDKSENTAKIYFSSSGDETALYQIVEL